MIDLVATDVGFMFTEETWQGVHDEGVLGEGFRIKLKTAVYIVPVPHKKILPLLTHSSLHDSQTGSLSGHPSSSSHARRYLIRLSCDIRRTCCNAPLLQKIREKAVQQRRQLRHGSVAALPNFPDRYSACLNQWLQSGCLYTRVQQRRQLRHGSVAALPNFPDRYSASLNQWLQSGCLYTRVQQRRQLRHGSVAALPDFPDRYSASLNQWLQSGCLYTRVQQRRQLRHGSFAALPNFPDRYSACLNQGLQSVCLYTRVQQRRQLRHGSVAALPNFPDRYTKTVEGVASLPRRQTSLTDTVLDSVMCSTSLLNQPVCPDIGGGSEVTFKPLC
ncbi:hypothetical protein J6590_018424 [Homalodisca vitripennis]|nr:hypothetical protein J6590_018424 [Homalodisca vitripennis]